MVDVNNLKLLRYPPRLNAIDFSTMPVPADAEAFTCDTNINLKKNQIAVFVDDDSQLTIV